MRSAMPTASAPSVGVLILTGSEDDGDLLQALDAGVPGYALKGIGGDELARILRLVARGESYVPPALAAGLLRGATRDGRLDQPAPSPLDGLSERECQILKLVAGGQSNKEIGKHLYLTEKTVKHYVTSILQKLNLRNRVEAAVFARDLDVG